MHFDEAEFQRRINTAMGKVRTLLDRTRHPQVPADVPHAYDDKYRLIEFVTRTGMAGALTGLEGVGLTPEGLAQLREWARTRSVTIRLEAREDCTFLRKTVREVESPTSSVTEVEGTGWIDKIRRKIVTKVPEWWWSFEFSYRIYAFQGADADEGLTLCERSGQIEIKTSTENSPRKKTLVRPAIDANVTWLLRHVDGQGQLSFAIDRNDDRCHTPRRNPLVEEGLRAFSELAGWCSGVDSYFRSELFGVQQDPPQSELDLAAISTAELFSPVVPLFEGDGRGGAGDPDVLPMANVNLFLEEQLRALHAKRRALAAAFPQNDTVITAQEASLLVSVLHTREVCGDFSSGVNYVEDMLRKQLIAAIGKVIQPSDFAEYMTFHHRKLFRPEFRPVPFSYAVRRPDHDPEGTLSLEVHRPKAIPVSTLVQRGQSTHPMRFPLGAATQVSFMGDRYLHAWVAHQFSGSREKLTLFARARQFSSYIVLLGRIASADTFEPRHAVIVQNKDVLEIPLELETIPTPKEFRDAIESLSPEQQRFAKAFRSMQLESTLFGVCVIQIKPQLEKLLKLPADSLTKEIKLTQDLLELFMEYQIPSDLLSYEGTAEAATEDKLEKVRDYVGRMHQLIANEKNKELHEAQQREAWRHAENDQTLSLDAFGGDPFGAPPGADPFASGASLSGMARSMPPRLGGMPPPPSAPAGGAAFAPPPAAQRAPVPAQPPTPVAAPKPAPPKTSPTDAAPRDPLPRDPRSTPTGPSEGEGVDYTKIPVALDKRLEKLDEDSALRPTIINPGDPWTKRFRKSLLADVTTQSLYENEQRTEKDRAFDLIDALSKSGAMGFEEASLHVVIAATHCFDKTLLETVIQGNVNPIEKVERSSMIVATTIHNRPAADLMMDDQRERFFATSPQLAGSLPMREESSDQG